MCNANYCAEALIMLVALINMLIVQTMNSFMEWSETKKINLKSGKNFFFIYDGTKSKKFSPPRRYNCAIFHSSSHTQNHVHNLIIAVPFKRPNVITFQSFYFLLFLLHFKMIFLFYLVWVDVDAMMKCRNLKCLKMFKHLRSRGGIFSIFLKMF